MSVCGVPTGSKLAASLLPDVFTIGRILRTQGTRGSGQLQDLHKDTSSRERDTVARLQLHAFAGYPHVPSIEDMVCLTYSCRALEMGGETIGKVHDSRLYKSLLPLVGPLTEPAVKRILESPTFQVCSAAGHMHCSWPSHIWAHHTWSSPSTPVPNWCLD